MARKKELNNAVEAARIKIEALRAQRDDIEADINKRKSKIAASQQDIGNLIADGKDVSQLSAGAVQAERELEDMQKGINELNRRLEIAENAWRDARAAELKEAIATYQVEALQVYRDAGEAFDQVELQASKLIEIQKSARESFSEMATLVTTPEKQAMEWRVQGLKKPAAILKAACIHYRSYLQNE